MEPREGRTGKRIGVSGKGGSGKSTVSALVAGALRGAGDPVAALDADATDVGLAGARNPGRDVRILTRVRFRPGPGPGGPR